MKTLIWAKVAHNGTSGVYETLCRSFQTYQRADTGAWMLFSRNDDIMGNWEWCQSFTFLADAKSAALEIQNETKYIDLLDPSTHGVT